jgi:hypothetical protein
MFNNTLSVACPFLFPVCRIARAVLRVHQAMVVTELCLGGDLARAMRRARGTRAFGWYMRGAKIALDVACGLAYLHQKSVSWPLSECADC